MDEDVAADLAKIDASYPGFPDPAAWADLQVDMSAWDDAASTLAEIRQSDPTLADELRDRAIREAGVDTGAIEGLYTTDRGFTMTVADAASLEDAARYVRSHKGADVEALFRAQVEGYEMALDHVVQGRPLTESWIRQLHEVITGPQDTYEVFTEVGPQEHALPKGEYKRHPNHVLQPDGTTFAYAPVAIVGDEMHRFVELANGDVVAAMHPVVASAWLHYALVRIHPFADGNGRVTRAVASLPLLGTVSIPFKVPADRRDAYLSALGAVDRGDPAALPRFARDEGLTSQRLLVRLARTRRSSPGVDDAYLSPAGVPIPTYDAAALRLRQLAVEALTAAVDRSKGDHVRLRTTHIDRALPAPDGWRIAVESPWRIPVVSVSTPEPIPAKARGIVLALVSREPGSGSDVCIMLDEREADSEVFTLSEADPSVTEGASERLDLWAESAAATLLGSLSDEVTRVRAKKGY